MFHRINDPWTLPADPRSAIEMDGERRPVYPQIHGLVPGARDLPVSGPRERRWPGQRRTGRQAACGQR
jgi:hypothetical protein